MPPKRDSKRQASKRTTPAVSAKRLKSESQSGSLPETTASTSQFSPTELSESISKVISPALQSAGIGNSNVAPRVTEPGTSTQSTQSTQSQPAAVDEATSKEIVDLTNTVAGGRLTFSSEKPDETFSSVTFDLESRASDRIKAKIWANEYVDVGSLLAVSPEESKYQISVTNDHDYPSLCLEHVKQKRSSLSIDQWVTTFNVFVAVYTIKVHIAISSLLKYCEVVRDIATKQGNWRYYDEQFRFLRQCKPGKYS